MAEEVDYESDPEDTKMALKMRRREASDDEEEEGDSSREKPMRRIDDFDGESEGAAAGYEDDLEEEEDYDLDEEFEGEGVEGVEYEELGGRDHAAVILDRGEVGKGVVDADARHENQSKNHGMEVDDGSNDGGGNEEVKKEVEPYAVPTSGAFYMHDDRFRGNPGGRNRRMFDGRKLWESRDNRKWGHDKFEELTVHERKYNEKRSSRGGFRGRSKNRISDQGNAQGYKPIERSSGGSQNNNIHTSAPKGFRGRGSQRYQPSSKNSNEAHLTHYKQSRKFVEKSYANSARTSESTAESNLVLPRKQMFASNLSISSPPFYPSGSSKEDNNAQRKSEIQVGPTNGNGQALVLDESFTVTQASAIPREKNKVGSVGLDKLSIHDPLSLMAGKSLNVQSQMRNHGRGAGTTSWKQLAYQPLDSNNQVNRVPPPSQLQSVSRKPGQSGAQSFVKTSDQPFTSMSSGLQAACAPNATGLEPAKESSSESSKSKAALVAKSKTSAQGIGKASLLYSGAHVTGPSGNMTSSQRDQNFPAFLPVMQFGGQHPGGMGVPAVGMAFPGYVGQPQLGMGGTSEMTWLPVLAGAAGALGASYCPPYISVDGSYHTRSSGQASTITAATSREDNLAMVDNVGKLSQRHELANDDSGHRQRNPRRYTEMKFDQ